MRIILFLQTKTNKMKKIVTFFLSIVLIALFSFVSCKDKDETGNQKITLEVAATHVQFKAVGVGNMTIDWGDETTPEIFLLSSAKSNFSHQYQSVNKHTIKITGHITSFYSGHFDLNGSYATNEIITIDANKNSTLKELDCSENSITQIDVSQCTSLTVLDCWDNLLATLNLNDNTALITLRCKQNYLTNLDVSNNKTLNLLSCSENTITKLDVTNNVKLKELHCDKNNLSYLELNNLFETLHTDTVNVKEKFIVVSGNPGSRFCAEQIAEKKGWTVYK